LLLKTKFVQKYLDTEKKILTFLISIFVFSIITVIIILLVLLEDKGQAFLEIFSFIIYLCVAYTIFKFLVESRKNNRLRINQIYIYSHKLMPMLKFKSTGSGSQGEMVENNAEYFYFFVSSSQFMAWSLLAGLLSPDDTKYVGLSFSGFALILIYIYIERKVHEAKSFKYIEIITINRDLFDELEKQALVSKNNKEVNHVEYSKDQDESEMEIQDRNDKALILNSQREWREFNTLLDRK